MVIEMAVEIPDMEWNLENEQKICEVSNRKYVLCKVDISI